MPEAEAEANKDSVMPSALFLKRHVANDWTRTGTVGSATGDIYETIEGNNNDEGSREGYEVCARAGLGWQQLALLGRLGSRCAAYPGRPPLGPDTRQKSRRVLGP